MTEALISIPVSIAGPFSPKSPGSDADVRFVGGTEAGPPTTGDFEVGDFVVDRSGAVWICVEEGTPGTWIDTSKSEVAHRTDATNFSWVAPDNTFKIVPGLTDTSFLLARPHHVYVGMWLHSTLANGIAAVGAFLDGVQQDYLPARLLAANTPTWISGLLRVPPPVAGEHTIDLRVNNYTGGTVTAQGTVNASKMTIVRA